jgi:dephospho-CoA kinase
MGCGKSTVGEFLKKYPDIYLFDSDEVAKEIIFETKNLEKIKSIFGEEVVINGKIDKQRLAKIVFADNQKKEELESFVHPQVWEKLAEARQKSTDEKIFIVESAILYEIGKEKDISKVIVVTCNKEEQIKRIKARNGWSDEQIEERLRHQLPNKVKENKGLVVINNNDSIEELKQKTEVLYSYIKMRKTSKLIL